MAKKSPMEIHEIVSIIKKLAKELGKSPTLREVLCSGVSRRQIDKHGGHNEVLKLAGLEPNFNPFVSHEVNPRMPKVLLFDIETSAVEALTWGGYEQNVGQNQVIKDWYVLSWAAKWHDSDEIVYQDVRSKSPNNPKIDYEILKGIHKMLSEADIVIGHNSNKFDIKKLNARFIKYRLKPLNHYKKFDTLRIARKHFNFTFNTLSYLAEYLEVPIKKSLHSKFPGMEMWKHCMGKVGNAKTRKEAFTEMESYNRTDVAVLQQIYDILAPYEPALKFSSYAQVTTCSCGSQTFIKDGLDYTAKGIYQRYCCKQCGKIFKDRSNNLISKKIRGEILS